MKSAMRPFYLLVLLLMSVVPFSCDTENFDVVTEVPDEFEPVVVTQPADTYLEYSLPGGEKVAKPSFGALTDAYVIAASDPIDCEPSGIYRVYLRDLSSYHIAFDRNSQPSELNAAFLTRVENGDTLYLGNLDFLEACAGTPQELVIRELTDTYVSGTFTAEFFDLESPVVNPLDPLACENWISVGLITADFSAELGDCN